MDTERQSQGRASGDSQQATAIADRTITEDRNVADDRNVAEDRAEKARRKAGDLGDKAQHAARDQIGARKAQTADRLNHVSSALRSSSDTLRQEEEASIAQVVDSAAAQIDRFAGYLSERSTEDLLHETRQVARRDPALFLGGAALLGLVGARFLRSSDRDGRR